MLFLVCSPLLIKKLEIVVGADGTNRAVVHEKTGHSRSSWKTVEVEEESSPVAATVQVEVAEAMETIGMDQAQ